MNKQTDEKSGMPSADDVKVIVSVLWKRGIIRINRDELQCKRKMIELGLTVPDGKDGCLVYGKEGSGALYLFVCGAFGIYGFRFDSAKYRSEPVEGLGGVGEAFLAFMGPMATLEGFDLAHCRVEMGRLERN